jgi:hypothetical protein
MQLEADVSNDGVLTATVPDHYRGRHVRITIEDADEPASDQWAAIAAVLDRAETQAITRRSHPEILDEIRQLRETT